jgi:GR25 family glycosyltransferase involved in LPS biosynthesis
LRIKANDRACVLSHKKAIELAQKSNWPSVLIFEDDIELPDDFDTQLDLLLGETPEFDMLFLHGTFGKFGKPVKYNDHLYKVGELYGAFAYIVHERFYEKVIRELEQQQTTLSTDYVYSMLMRTFVVFRAAKPIAFHRPGWSERAERQETMYKHLEKK